MFDIKGKVALITGGASGIGLSCAKELLKNGAKGVTIADMDSEAGAKALDEIQKEFGNDKAIFTLTDVTKSDQLESAFQQTIDKFKNIDILFNNAGVFQDNNWRKEIDINLIAVVQGCLLAIDKYFPKYKQGEEGVIVNTSSIGATEENPFAPIYGATKCGVLGLTISWGSSRIYPKTKVRMVAFCPGTTITPMLETLPSGTLGKMYTDVMMADVPNRPTQEPEQLAKEVVNVVKHAPTGTVWVIENCEPAYEYKIPDRSTMRDNVLQI